MHPRRSAGSCGSPPYLVKLSKEYNMLQFSRRHFLAAMAVLISPSWTSAAAASRCGAAIGNCDYYQCLEDEVQSCGEQGYVLGYVKPYCQKFVATDFPEVTSAWSDEVFPDDANPWRDAVLVCLQRSMDQYLAKNPRASCEAIQNFGFASHPLCYTAGPSFCAITPQNVFRVGLVIGPSIFRPMLFRQVVDTAKICVDQLNERIAAEDRPWLKNQLGAYKNLWQVLAADPYRILLGLAVERPDAELTPEND